MVGAASGGCADWMVYQGESSPVEMRESFPSPPSADGRQCEGTHVARRIAVTAFLKLLRVPCPPTSRPFSAVGPKSAMRLRCSTGRIGVVGVFLPEDPGAKDKLAKRGQIAFDFGQFWLKGQSMGTGQANVKAYNRQLSRLIEHGKVAPSQIISHELPLEEAPRAYENFDKRTKGWTKVVLKPAK